jgi:hypothetical protein
MHTAERARPAVGSPGKTMRQDEFDTPDDSPGDAPRGDSFRNPPWEWRVALTAAAWVLPGVLVGGLVNLLVPVTAAPSGALAAGAVLGAAAGAVLEYLR